MADYSIISPSEAFSYQFWVEAGQLRTSLPGIIVGFDAATQIARVRPACRMKVNIGDGVKHVDLPVIENVPVVLPFAQGAGLLLTLPIKPGDECLIVFADRAIDYFVERGGIQNTDTSAQPDVSYSRQHHLTDAICIPGIISNPQAVPEYSTTHIEMRDRAREHFISMGPDGITISDSKAVWRMAGGEVTLEAPEGIKYTTPKNMTVNSRNVDLGDDNRILGNMSSDTGTFTDYEGVNLNTHKHMDVRSGSDISGEPVADRGGILDTLREEATDAKDKTILCIPDIADGMVMKESDPAEAQGWLYLQEMMTKWVTGPVNRKPKDCKYPFFVDWDWAMRLKSKLGVTSPSQQLGFFTDPDFAESYPEAPENIYNTAARMKLGAILARTKILGNANSFDFTQLDWTEWEDKYYTLRRVERPIQICAQAAVFGSFTLRALAKGTISHLSGKEYRIDVTHCSIFIHDLYTFAKESFEKFPGLGYWDCEKKDISVSPFFGGEFLNNEYFRNFQAQTGYGHDYIVLSKPREFTGFQPFFFTYSV